MKRLRALVSFGWIIYPAGYVVGALEVGNEDGAAMMILLYNLADLVNKLAFVIIVLIAARGTQEALQGNVFQAIATTEIKDEDYDDSGLLELAQLASEATEEPELDL